MIMKYCSSSVSRNVTYDGCFLGGEVIIGHALSLLWVAEALEQLKDQYDGSALGNPSETNDHRVYVDLDQQDVGML